ncbi:MAG: DNA polymerase V subunit [Candidatus Magasanikbacteria bacterium]|nr:DNA polymerase V subunit [Candidatus Magasanikbacteria bacterium]
MKPVDKKRVEALTRFWQAHKRLPSYREMLQLFSWSSKGAVHHFVERLIRIGLIRRDAEHKLSPTSRLLHIPILGTVEAGWPSPAEEELVDNISLDEYLIPRRESTFLLKVSGDSMINAGINPGDLVLLERGRDPKHGDIVVAEVDHDWTMKYFDQPEKFSPVRLRAANPKYPVITADEEIKIAGVVVGVVRKYH